MAGGYYRRRTCTGCGVTLIVTKDVAERADESGYTIRCDDCIPQAPVEPGDFE